MPMFGSSPRFAGRPAILFGKVTTNMINDYELQVGKNYIDYNDGDIFYITINVTNTDAATLTVTGNSTLSTYSIYDSNGLDIPGGVLQANKTYAVMYSDQYLGFVLQDESVYSRNSTMTIEAGENISKDDLVIVALQTNSSGLTGGTVYRADTTSDDLSTLPYIYGIAQSDANAGDMCFVVTDGVATVDSYMLNAGEYYYMTSTPGAISTIGSADSPYIAIGLAIRNNQLYVMPATRTKRLQNNVYINSGNFVVPPGVNVVYVTMCGGGGGGGGGMSHDGTYDYTGGGGAGGNYVICQPVNVEPLETIAITIGSGGSGGTANLNGNPGGASSFGSYITVDGGAGGKRGGYSGGLFYYPYGGSGGFNGGNGVIYDRVQDALRFAPTPAQSGETFSGGLPLMYTTITQGGCGGAGLVGQGGAGGVSTNDGDNATGYGAGGGGGGDGHAGGDGTGGYCKVEWFE